MYWNSYGAPSSALISFRSRNGSDQLEIRLELVDKQPTRLPEATWLQFSAAQQSSSPLAYELNKLGDWVNPLQVVDGGAKSLQGVAPDGVSLRISSGMHADGYTPRRLSVASLDSGVVRFDTPYPTPTPIFRQPDIAANGAHFALHMNTWNSECSASMLHRAGADWADTFMHQRSKLPVLVAVRQR